MDEEEEVEEGERRGFDRLRSMLSREEVQALRLTFYPQVSAYMATAETIEGEESQERIYRMEEEWMRSQGPLSEFALNVRTPEWNGGEVRIEMPDAQMVYAAAVENVVCSITFCVSK